MRWERWEGKATLLGWSAEEKLTSEGGSKDTSQAQPQSGEFSGCESVLPLEFSSMKRIKILGYTKEPNSIPGNRLREPERSVDVTRGGRAHSLTCLHLVTLDHGPPAVDILTQPRTATHPSGPGADSGSRSFPEDRGTSTG